MQFHFYLFSTTIRGNAVYARIGDLNLLTRDDDARPQERRIVERIRHPEYKRPAEYNDIALLKLDSPVKFDAYVRPACLSTQPNFFSRSAEPKAVATGWGRVDWGNKPIIYILFYLHATLNLKYLQFITCVIFFFSR